MKKNNNSHKNNTWICRMLKLHSNKCKNSRTRASTCDTGGGGGVVRQELPAEMGSSQFVIELLWLFISYCIARNFMENNLEWDRSHSRLCKCWPFTTSFRPNQVYGWLNTPNQIKPTLWPQKYLPWTQNNQQHKEQKIHVPIQSDFDMNNVFIRGLSNLQVVFWHWY